MRRIPDTLLSASLRTYKKIWTRDRKKTGVDKVPSGFDLIKAPTLGSKSSKSSKLSKFFAQATRHCTRHGDPWWTFVLWRQETPRPSHTVCNIRYPCHPLSHCAGHALRELEGLVQQPSFRSVVAEDGWRKITSEDQVHGQWPTDAYCKQRSEEKWRLEKNRFKDVQSSKDSKDSISMCRERALQGVGPISTNVNQ